MTSLRLKHEGWLYWLAFLIAIGFRLVQLGATPLTDSESSLALHALQIAQGKDPLLAPQPAYILFTSVLFLIIESTNFMARIIPALAGGALVFIPYFFRDRLKPLPALILAFLFAFDPALVALSRQAGGTILAVTFLLFAWGMWRKGRAIPAGIFAALALLSGSSVWSGLLMLGITWIFLQGMVTRQNNTAFPEKNDLRNSLIAILSTLLLAGTLFFTVPNGLSAALSALPAYLGGWVSPSVFTPARVLLAFIAYEPLGIFLAVFALIRGFRLKSPRVTRLGIWLAVSLLIALFYRQPGELVWAVIPLLILAARELSRSLDIYSDERVEIGIVAGVIVLLLVYLWINVANIALNPYDQIASTAIPFLGRMLELPIGPRYVILFGAALILAICITLVAFGWSPRTARLGMTWSFSLVLGVYAIASAWGASGLRTQNGVELWASDQSPLQASLLLATVNDVSRFSLGHAQAQPVTIMGINSPALEWTLRNHEVKIVSVLDPLDAPPLVISPPMNDLGLPSAYRGQDFIWRQPPMWDGIQSPDWIRWLVYRQLPRETETIILWARDDLFPDARENTPQ
jgi:hypothetical protein